MNKKKILLVSEAATLAHVARPLAISAILDRERFELSIACSSRSHWLLRDFPGDTHNLYSIEPSQFLAALANGTPLYDEPTLQRYVKEDLELLDKVRPDIVIGDFRLSLSVSARLAQVPYLAISNCYWSPYWRPARYPVPSLPISRILALGIADILFQLARPIAFTLHCSPLNRVRKSYGLPSLGTDLRRVYTDADHVLYADVPELFSNVRLPLNHHFIGPLLWSPPIAVPDWWDKVGVDRPVVYVTLGSSGQAKLLPKVLDALGELDITVISSTAGGVVPNALPRNTYAANYLPGDEAARRSKLVICNGGSPTSQQALVAGVPVIGIAGNLDQFLNMGAIKQVGAGSLIRADRFVARELKAHVAQMMDSPAPRHAAEKIAGSLQRINLKSQLDKVLSLVESHAQ